MSTMSILCTKKYMWCNFKHVLELVKYLNLMAIFKKNGIYNT